MKGGGNTYKHNKGTGGGGLHLTDIQILSKLLLYNKGHLKHIRMVRQFLK